MADSLDGFDLRILSVLSTNGRISWHKLAEHIGLSPTPTLRRVRALEAKGYITGYRADVNEAKLGRAISVFVSVSLERQTDEALRQFELHVVSMPAVMTCFMMTGTADYLLRAVLTDLAEYQSFIAALAAVPGVARVSSSFSVKPVVQRPTPPLPIAPN